jgi:GntR family transcriptional regulator, transcriptional repressor for pyruvate dehydrogenase complex
VPFAPVKKQKVSDQVAESIRDAIVTGQVRPSESLPSERELAERFGVNRSSIREALHRLEAWGLVQVRQGYATVVRNLLRTAGPELLPFLMAPEGKPDPKIFSDLLAMRTMILVWTARQAAMLGPRGDLDALRAIVAKLEAEGHSAEDLQVLDFDFFEELVHLTENRVLTLFSNTIRQVYLERPALFALLYQPEKFDPTPHRRALTAIAAGDPEGAARAMEAHAEVAVALLRAARLTPVKGGKP